MMIRAILIIGFLFPVIGFANTQSFKLNSGAPESLSNDAGDAFYNLIASEIFQRLGIELTYIRLPSGRSLMQANKGIDDGNIARIKGMEKKWPNLIRVPENIIIWEFTAYSLTKDTQMTDWESLKTNSVGFVRGWQIYEKKMTGAETIVRANNPQHLFDLLKKGRIERALFERFQSAYWFNKAGFTPEALSPSLAKKPLFIYLHKKHKNLVSKMADIVLQMKKDGAYQRIFDRSFKNNN